MVRSLAKPALLILVVIAVSGCGPQVPQWGEGGEPQSGPDITDAGVRFTLYAPRVEKVTLVGDFNNWSTTADPMYDREGTGLWTILIPLAAGRHEYKFLLESEKWVPDPGNPEMVDDGFGGFNSVIVIE